MPNERDIIIEESVSRSRHHMISDLAFYEDVVLETFGKENTYALIAKNYIHMAKIALEQEQNSQD